MASDETHARIDPRTLGSGRPSHAELPVGPEGDRLPKPVRTDLGPQDRGSVVTSARLPAQARTSPNASTEARLSGLVVGVIAAAVRSRTANGVVLASPPGPETNLLTRWIRQDGGFDVIEPDRSTVARIVRVLRRAIDPPLPGPEVVAEAFRTQARMLARKRRAIPVSTVNRTALLLGYPVPPEPVLAFADLRASRILELAGGCCLPREFDELEDQGVLLSRVEALLDDHLYFGAAVPPFLSEPLPDVLRSRVIRAANARAWRRSLWRIVPKIENLTLGLELDL